MLRSDSFGKNGVFRLKSGRKARLSFRDVIDALVVRRVTISSNSYPRHIGVVGSPICPVTIRTPLDVAGRGCRSNRASNDSPSTERSERVPPAITVPAITWPRVSVAPMAIMPARPNARRAMHTAPDLMTSAPDSLCLNPLGIRLHHGWLRRYENGGGFYRPHSRERCGQCDC